MMSDDARAVPEAGSDQPILPALLVIYVATIVAQLVSLAFGRVDESRTFASIVVPSVVYLTVITLPATWIGLALGRGLSLGAPLISALIVRQKGSLRRLLVDSAMAAVPGVLIGGLMLALRVVSRPYLPPELPDYGYRGVIGGLAVSFGAAVGEEVWFRLGLMTMMIWVVARVTGRLEARPVVVWPIIIFTSFAFGLAHVPQLMSYGAASSAAVAATVLGNVAVGILYAWCYWRRSLIAAMVAHFVVDIVLHALPALFG